MPTDMFDATLDATITFRLFSKDKDRLAEIVADSHGKYADVGHAVRCAVQAFIKQWGDV